MNEIALNYVRLALAMGEHDGDYVDAYYGPAELKDEAKASPMPLSAIRRRAEELRLEITRIPRLRGEIEELRRRYLAAQLMALITRIDVLSGRKMSFDEESQALYQVVAPHHDEAYFETLIDQLQSILEGSGPLLERYDRFREQFVIPEEKVDDVFREAVDGSRAMTLAHIALPEGESFSIEYVRGKSWSGYNWYQGEYRSLIQVNVDLPIYIDRAVDLAAHEGYPGHHVYNMLLEKNMLRDRGWIEFSVYPLFSPQSLIAEGSANFGIDVVFPGSDRVEYERRTLYPIAGLDGTDAGRYAAVQEIVTELNYAHNEAARRYLAGAMDARTTAEWLYRFALMPHGLAERRVRFFDQYRSYVINYNAGKDLVHRYIDSRGGTADQPEVRWKEFERLISSPRLPADLAAE